MEGLLRSFYGATAGMAVPRRSWGCRGDPTADWPNPRCQCGSFEHVKSFRRATANVRACLTVFGVATAINNGTTAEPRRAWRCHCGLCRTSTAVAQHLRCDGGISHGCFWFFLFPIWFVVVFTTSFASPQSSLNVGLCCSPATMDKAANMFVTAAMYS